jgi:hypothetical protein
MDADVEKYIATIPVSAFEFALVKSELAASTAIAKAERTNRLNADQIRQVRKILDEIGDVDQNAFLRVAKERLTKREMGTLDVAFTLRDALEQYLIFVVFREANAPAGPAWTRESMGMETLLSLHSRLTTGLDDFSHLERDCNHYTPGVLRGIGSEGLRVGKYSPQVRYQGSSEISSQSQGCSAKCCAESRRQGCRRRRENSLQFFGAAR